MPGGSTTIRPAPTALSGTSPQSSSGRTYRCNSQWPDRSDSHYEWTREWGQAILSNDADFARRFFQGIFLECPPSFHTSDQFQITEEWLTDQETKAFFAGMLAGAKGWDPLHNIPDNIQQSLEEAKRSLEIANYRSCVAMSRRTLEAVLKFGYERLLKKKPVNKKGGGLMLNDMIQGFRSQKPQPIPEHLLHIADSIRLIGNVPGAH